VEASDPGVVLAQERVARGGAAGPPATAGVDMEAFVPKLEAVVCRLERVAQAA